jgi:energy-coupling factor transport system substrate-specific component
MKLAIASLAGLALFFWPFGGGGVPAAAPAVAVSLGAVLALTLLELGARELDARLLALLAAIAAIDAALRTALVNGIGGFSPIFFLVLCAGFVFGPSYGFLAGATSLLVSALVSGGIGPWLPYQVFATAWVGVGAGLAGRVVKSIWVLALVGAIAGFGFGALMDIWDWTFFRGSPEVGWTPGLPLPEAALHFGRFYLLTSLAYDSFRAGGNALMVLLLGPPVVAALRRMQARFHLEILADARLPV